MNGVVVIGEGEKDEAPMLFNGEHVGDGTGAEVDIAVDPVDGTTLTAKSLPDAVSVLGVSPRGTMFDPGPAVYMQKLVVPAAVAEQVDLDAPIADTLRTIAGHGDRKVSDPDGGCAGSAEARRADQGDPGGWCSHPVPDRW
jgi:fructose-1,6-bisphosphatase II